jgi:hypothetical protein
MALEHTYYDAYLKAHVTEERETRAASEVAEFGTFATEWEDRLEVLRTYVITCLECQAQPDDLFAQKLKNYRAEFDSVLAQARAATQDQDGNPLTVLTIPIERA